MVSGNISGKKSIEGTVSSKKSIGGDTNIPVKLIKYEGLETDTALTTVDNKNNTISVDVKVEEVTKDCASKEELQSHINDKNNPHEVTKEQIGLSNVDNTSDLDKPISTATQEALNNKQDTLVSGQNIKTINNESILGEGNIELSVNPIEEVESLEDVPDNDLGLYRYMQEDEETGNDVSSHIIEVVKEEHAGGEVSYEKTTTSNNTQLNNATFMEQFDNELSNFISIVNLDNIYSLYYQAVPFNGIRVGTKQVGTIQLTASQDIDIVVYKYFSYNGSTGVKTYDTNAEFVIDGEEVYTFEDDITPVTVTLSAGTHTISSGGQNKRVILTAFEVSGESYNTFTKHELARVEEVEAVQDNLDTHIETSNTRFTNDEKSIQTNANNIELINNKIGPIQIYKVYNRLPNPTDEFLDKIFRYQEKYYQCVQRGDGEHKEFEFNVQGGSEITIDNYEAFMHEVSGSFDEYFEIPTYETQHENPETGEIVTETVLEAIKLFRNNGTIRIGSSSYEGSVDFRKISDLPITSLKIGVKAYNANKPSSLYIETGDDNADYSFNYLLEDNVNETLINLTELTDSDNLNYIYLESESTYTDESGDEPVVINCDKRVVITRIIANFGDVHYEWSLAGGGGADIPITDLTGIN